VMRLLARDRETVPSHPIPSIFAPVRNHASVARADEVPAGQARQAGVRTYLHVAERLLPSRLRRPRTFARLQSRGRDKIIAEALSKLASADGGRSKGSALTRPAAPTPGAVITVLRGVASLVGLTVDD